MVFQISRWICWSAAFASFDRSHWCCGLVPKRSPNSIKHETLQTLRVHVQYVQCFVCPLARCPWCKSSTFMGDVSWLVWNKQIVQYPEDVLAAPIAHRHGTSLAERVLQLFWPSWVETHINSENDLQIAREHTSVRASRRVSTFSYLVVYCTSMPTAVSLNFERRLDTISRFSNSTQPKSGGY